ncbi:MAG: hypothetical protein KGY45_00575 [Hadesarchaea archaeon]|nr:hypothetical protein [Hadesarchaea archaeon]
MENFKKQNNSSSFYAHLYDDPSTKNLKITELANYLREKSLFKKTDARKSLLENNKESVEDLAEKFSRTRIRDLRNPKSDFDPLLGEIRFEKDLVRNPEKKITGILYDGPSLMRVFHELIPEEERNYSHLHIIFTNRLIGTWDQGDHRYHARVSVYGYPSLVSTTGIVEAPAKPKEFYRLKRKLAASGKSTPLELLKEKFEGRFIDYDDDKLTEVMKGYLIQAVFHHFTSNPFCENENCRLYNGHWQEEVIKAQLSEPDFCSEHEKAIEGLKKKLRS